MNFVRQEDKIMNETVKRSVSMLALAGMVLTGSTTIASAQDTTLIQKNAFGTITRGSTVCVGPLEPRVNPSGETPGVQIAGFTQGPGSLTWQLFTRSSQSADALVFSTTALSVDHTQPPSGNFLFLACVVKSSGSAQDFSLQLNSYPVE
jgi:hypothetical protein